jgi:peptidyl-tRNA hydrolase, PTH1 family
MNLSGDVVAPLARQLALAPDRILVVYDDFDLPLGAKRLRARGGPGTHNGMRSLVNRLAAEFPDHPAGEFSRLRIGIGAAGTDAARHVLERFSPKERTEIEIAVEEAADAVLDWLRTGDIDGCMARYHSRWNQGV